MENALVLPDWVQGTIIGEILNFHPNGEPISPLIEISKEIGSNEKVIGEMNLFEKIVSTLFDLKMKELNGLKEEDPNPDNVDLTRDLDRKAYTLDKETDLLRDMMWKSITVRFPVQGNLGLRKDFKIVLIGEKDDGEDCANCPVRDVCPNAHF